MSDLLISGAGGRVGSLLRGPLAGRAILARRGPGAALDWDPLAGPGALREWCERHGPPAALLQLARGLPEDRARDDAAIGRATLEAARAAGIGRVLLASSSAVYGRSRADAWGEDEAVDPPSPYGRSKRAMELACAGPGVCCLRIGNVAGADALLTGTRRPVLLDRFADGAGPARNYIGPGTLARVLLALARAPALPPLLNLATPRPVDMADLARAAGLPVEWQPAPEGALARVTLDMRRLESLVAFADTDSDPATMVAEWRAAQEPR
ncbi:MAG: NAD-dependent epimerase/dehydratase family protein [Rhodobacteraceae bacterium]|nr:NAD-dependent epimerase/dehydratase family protein [Paracoccaceae bacterium]